MKKSVLIAFATLSIGLASGNLFAQTPTQPTQPTPPPTQPVPPPPPPVPPVQQTPTTTTAKPDTSAKDLDATIANVQDLTTLAAAIKAANLDATLKGPGPFTVFAPGNAAFGSIPKTRLDSLLKDPVKLGTLVKAHVVAGKYDKAAVIKALTDGKGKATLKTVDGQTLEISVVNKKLQIKDAQGNTAEVTSFDTPATNGVIHGINGVFMYK